MVILLAEMKKVKNAPKIYIYIYKYEEEEDINPKPVTKKRTPRISS
jgi:hypothetical protein